MDRNGHSWMNIIHCDEIMDVYAINYIILTYRIVYEVWKLVIPLAYGVWSMTRSMDVVLHKNALKL
jgi:hypothetical protein